MDKCYKMVGAFFSRVTSSHSRRRDANPQVVDVIRAVPHNGMPAKEASATGAYKAGVWVWDAPHARTSPRAHRSRRGERCGAKDQRKCHSMEWSGEHSELRVQLPGHKDSQSVTPSTTSELDHDVAKHASLSRRAQSMDTSSETTDRYMTLPYVTRSSRPASRNALNTETRNPSSIDTGTGQKRGQWKEEEVRHLAKSMVCSIESVIDNLHGIVGDLRQLVQQIDVITEFMDAGRSSGTTNAQRENKMGPESTSAVQLRSVHTQTDLDEPCYASIGHSKYVERCDPLRVSPSHRYSYPQCCRSPVSTLPSPSGFDTDRGMHRQSASPRPGDGPHTVQIIVKSPSPHKQRVHSEARQSRLSTFKQMRSSPLQQRPKTFSGAPFQESLGPSLVPSHCGHSPEPSMPFIPVESPPNPAPTLFSAYREDSLHQVKDTDSLPDRGLKTWKEKMEQYCGSADSLTPQMDWSYLVLTDHHLAPTVEECAHTKSSDENLSKASRSQDPSSSQKDCHGLKLTGYSLDSRRVHKERARLSQASMRIKHYVSAITRIPEQGEPCDSSYDEDRDVFSFEETCSAVSAPCTSARVVQAVSENADVCRQGLERLDHHDPRSVSSASQEMNSLGVLPQSQQGVGGASLGWNTNTKALPNWPSEELSSIAASDCELDDLSSPFIQQNFQYPRRSSALDSSFEKNNHEDDLKLVRTSSIPETVASEGFEVRPDLQTSTESEVLSTYASQYENAMESRLEQLTNEVEGSDFSDADADVGSDVLEQSLTSLEETSSVKYDRELNTWTSYTMTHIDSDDVVSECTSDVLNENLLEMVTTNPGFDDVSLNFDDIGYLPLPLQGNAIEMVSPSLE